MTLKIAFGFFEQPQAQTVWRLGDSTRHAYFWPLPLDRNHFDNTCRLIACEHHAVRLAAQWHGDAILKRHRVWQAIETFANPIDVAAEK